MHLLCIFHLQTVLCSISYSTEQFLFALKRYVFSGKKQVHNQLKSFASTKKIRKSVFESQSFRFVTCPASFASFQQSTSMAGASIPCSLSPERSSRIQLQFVLLLPRFTPASLDRSFSSLFFPESDSRIGRNEPAANGERERERERGGGNPAEKE